MTPVINRTEALSLIESIDLIATDDFNKMCIRDSLDAVCNALSKLSIRAHIATYSEHALDTGSDSRAAAYVGIDLSLIHI